MTYARLHESAQKLGELHNALALLSWDEAVLMPVGAGAGRGETLAALAGMAHDLASDPNVDGWLQAADEETLDTWQRANLDQIRRAYIAASAVPRDLVVALSKATSACEQRWRDARAVNDWTAVEGLLAEVVRLTSERAQALAEKRNVSPYDALLDEYEPGLTCAVIDPVFDDLAAFLPAFVDRAIAAQGEWVATPGPIDVERQEQLGRELMRAVGFDFERGRLDVSHHPFCGGIPDDTRITTRYNENDFLESLFAVLHESGHALYQQGLPVAWRGQPVGDAGGMALHESQSLLMEMQVCRGDAFLEFAAPIVRRTLGLEGVERLGVDELGAMARRVRRGLIRVDADEVTYPLHVILRYQLETALLSGDLGVADVPGAWNEKMRDFLSLNTAGDYENGCMQDVHWFAGLIGYFPTYTLGAVAAAQFFAAARERLPDVEASIARGEFAPLVDWLRTNIHSLGRRYATDALLERVTGRPLETSEFKAHLERRYLR